VTGKTRAGSSVNGSGPGGKITPADIEAKFRELEDDITSRTDRAKNTAFTVGAVAIGVTIVLAYWFGRRSMRKRRTVLEIRRL
jgi:hypothetical protein